MGQVRQNIVHLKPQHDDDNDDHDRGDDVALNDDHHNKDENYDG